MMTARSNLATVPIVTMEELPVLSDFERAELMASLKLAEEEFANGEGKPLTRESLWAMFEASRK
jgi:hypothetical protein